MHKQLRTLQQGLALGVAATMLGAAGQAGATTILKRTLDEMVQDVDRIVVGELVSTEAAWNLTANEKDVVYTTALLRVDQQLKGEEAGTYVELFGIGGTLDGHTTEVPGSPELAENGRRMIVFLWDDVAGEFMTNVAYWQQGQYLVDDQGMVERTGQPEAEFIQHLQTRVERLSK